MSIMFNGSGGVVGMPGASSGLDFAMNSYNQNNNFLNNLNNQISQGSTFNPWANTPGGFGAQTAAYAGAGAAFGRAVGSAKAPGTYSPGNPGNLSPFSGTPMGGASRGGSDPFTSGTSPVPYLGGSGAGMPFGGGGFSGFNGDAFSRGASPVNTSGGYAPFGGGGFAPPQQTFNNRFAGGSGGFNAFDPGIFGGAAQGNIGGRAQPKAGAQAPPLTGTPWDMSDPDTPSPGGSSVHSRGMGIQPPFQNYGGYANPGAFSPNPNTSGTSFGDRWGGFGTGQAQQSGPQPGPSAASLGAQAGRMANSPFNVGSSAVPYQYAGGQAFPGAGIGSNTPTNQRDLLGAIMSGSQGNTVPVKASGGDDDGDGGFHGRWGEMQAPATPSFGQGASAVPGLAGRGYFGAVPGGGVGADNSNAFFGGGYPGASGLGQTTPGGRGHFESAFGAPPASSGSSGGIGSDMLRGGQDEPYAKDWHSLIPGNKGLNTPEIIKQVNYTAGRNRQDPAALAGVIDTESVWNPKTNTGTYYGATQMGEKSFKEAGGRLGGMNFNQYKGAPLEQQIPAYGDWLAHYAKAPDSAAALATSDIRGLPVPMQYAIMQGTQFGPYSGLPGTTNWPGALAGGNMNMSASPIDRRTGLPAPQAEFLGPGGKSPYPTISSMNDYAYRRGWGG